MNDFATKKREVFTSHFDIIRKIETMCGEIPYAIKQFKAQVMSFLSMEKRLASLKSKAEKKANTKVLDKFEAFIVEYKGAYRRCYQSYTSISKTIDTIAELYAELSEFYYSEGKRREAKRATADGDKYDKFAKKQLSAVFNRLNSAAYISLAKEEKSALEIPREKRIEASEANAFYKEDLHESGVDFKKEEMQARESHQQNNAQKNASPSYGRGAQYNSAPQYNAAQYNQGVQYSAPQYTGANPQYNPNVPPFAGAHYQQNNAYGYPQPDYRTPPTYYPPQNFNITPISIDVNSAVESLFEAFAKAFDERTREFIANYKFPEVERQGITEGESRALDKIVDDESFALEKLSALLEKINLMFESLSELTAKYAELEEKSKAISLSMKNASDTQRALAREIQGIQATQKVIGNDQLKLAEEQAVVVEAQKAAIASQAELNEAENAITAEISAILAGADKTLEGFKSSLSEQNGITEALAGVMAANGKLIELQKNLEERQSELTEMQREALLAQKRLARSQKAVNERIGAKLSKKEKNAEKISEEFSEEASDESLEATV